jgi:exodeoxyribonuclease VII large subunit
MFRGNAMRLRFRPENGMKIVATGKVSVYPRDGAYQLYCANMTVDGVGDLHVAFEQLKSKLSAQGLFDPAHKKLLPQYPGTIGIITSSAGAAVHDMIRILRKRYPLTKVRLLPVRVQGEEAPAEIAEAIRYANYYGLADLLIVGRGGGSIEDLWAFNDETVAHAIYQSQIPIISAVGHEPDVTISDYVADLRAATPSNAAELAVPDQDVLRQNLDSASGSLMSAITKQLINARRQLKTISASSVLQGPTQYIKQRKMMLTHLTDRLTAAQAANLSRKRNMFISHTAKLEAMSPLKVLTRGYSVVQNSDGELIKSISQTPIDSQIRVKFSDGSVTATVTDRKEN